jgi:predicted DNA-binding transcriptional regulator YafY
VRADRLVAIVLLLQVHGRMTASEIAGRLETSERTIRRDLDALCTAGVPVYPQRGRGGGWTLLGGHRIDLTGLTADEAQALLVAADSGSATLGPGFGEGLAAARRKLLAALPEVLRQRVDAAAGAVIVDRTRWGPADPGDGDRPATESTGDPQHLTALRRAVLSGLQVVVLYEPPGRAAEERRLHPHGLVCKRGVWYLVATAPAGLRTYRLSRVRSVRVTEDPVAQPEGFDLARAWADMQRRFSSQLATPVVVEADVEPSALRRLRATVGAWWPVEEAGRGPRGRVRVRLRFPHACLAATELLALGEHLEVVTPEEVRAELAATGLRLAERYGTPARR